MITSWPMVTVSVILKPNTSLSVISQQGTKQKPQGRAIAPSRGQGQARTGEMHELTQPDRLIFENRNINF
jgi:hypothetical protein